MGKYYFYREQLHYAPVNLSKKKGSVIMYSVGVKHGDPFFFERL